MMISAEYWNNLRNELGKPTIEGNRYNFIVQTFGDAIVKDRSQFLLQESDQKTHHPSLAALYAPRNKSKTDKEGLNRPATQIARHIYRAVHQVKEETDSTILTAKIEYSQFISRLSRLVQDHLDRVETERLSRISITHVHQSDETFQSKKKQSSTLSKAILEPKAMPVYQSELSELQPFFTFLESNFNPFDSSQEEKHIQPAKMTDYGQYEFERGVVYLDGRMDLCKQSVIIHIDLLMQALLSNQHVKHFLLGNNIVGTKGAQAIASFVLDPTRKCPVETYYLAGNDLDKDSIDLLVNAWLQDTHIRNLWLKRNPVLSEGAFHVARLLTSPTRLHHIHLLDLDNCGLLDSGCEILFEALRSNDQVKHVYLSGNGITHVGAKHIADYFLARQTQGVKGLRSLFMSVNRIGDQGAKHLASFLPTEHHLKRLMLSSNSIETEGGQTLFSALCHNDSLHVLDLGLYTSTGDLGELPNRIKDDCIPSIIRWLGTLPSKSSLRYLDLTHNGFTLDGIQRLELAFYHYLSQTSLVHLSLAERNVPRDMVVWKSIKAQLIQNAQRIYLQETNTKHAFADFLTHRLRNVSDTRFITSVYRTRDFARNKRKNLVKLWP